MLTHIALYAGLVGLVPGVAPEASVTEHRSLAELVPTPCLLYMSLDVPALLEGLSKTPLNAAWDESGFAEDWHRAMETAGEKMGEALTDVDFDQEDFSWILKGEIAFALGPIDASVRDEAGKIEFPSIAMLVDAGEHGDDLERFTRKWVDLVRDNDEPVTEEDFRGVTLYTVVPEIDAEEDPDNPFSDIATICFAQVGSVFMICFDEEVGRNVIRAATGDDAVGTLAADSDYRLIRERTDHPESMSFYVDVATALDMTSTFMPSDEDRDLFEEVCGVVGVSGLRGIGGGYSVREDGLWSRFFALNPGPQDGFLWDFVGVSGPTTAPAFLPADVGSFTVAHVDFPSLWDNVLRVIEIAERTGPGLPGEPIADAEAMLGFQFADLFGSLEGQVTFFSRVMEDEAPAESAMNPFAMGMSGMNGLDVALRLREVDTLKQVLVKLEELAAEQPGGWPFEQTEYLGRILRVLKPGLTGELAITPAFTITDNLFAFSLATETLQDVIRQLGTTDEGLGASDSFQRVAGYLPSDASLFSYTSVDAVDKYMSQIEMMFEMLEGMTPADQTDGFELVAGMVPKLRTMIESFDAALGYATVSPEGCSFTSGWLFAETE